MAYAVSRGTMRAGELGMLFGLLGRLVDGGIEHERRKVLGGTPLATASAASIATPGRSAWEAMAAISANYARSFSVGAASGPAAGATAGAVGAFVGTAIGVAVGEACAARPQSRRRSHR